ncbi:substrate-binding domain-containing protein [uncultured Thioclava sp.]|uniref:LacI family DNA-binding transcriptional regulator n=1 Tax=uncultured Thioclava sp. TaxID=473858 RepID=UPI0025FA7F1F|nr:substrate-binding domain-containing protein [uncultured Thioclava sp.]
MKKNITIKDVARVAGVSNSTVSHVVNSTRFVSPETAQRVRAASSERGFAPNGVAQALKGHRTRTIGMIVTSSTNPFFAELIHGVETACFTRGYSLILCNSEDDREKVQAYLDTLRAKRIDALIILSSNQQPGMTAELARTSGVPTVALDDEDAAPASTIADDSLTGGTLAATYLTERGFRRIACITGPLEHSRSAIRFKGFTEELSRRGIHFDPALAIASDPTVAGGDVAMRALLSLPQEQRPQAVFCFNDVMAMGALSAAYQCGIEVPGQISVMGYDDIEIAAFTAPPLTTIRQPMQDLGQRAASVIIDHLETDADLPDRIRLTPKLIERSSVGQISGPQE